MYPSMVSTLPPVNFPSTVFEPYLPSSISTLFNNSFIQTSTLNGVGTLHLNISEYFSTDFESNLTEVFLHEPRFVSDVPEKVYYGRIKTMSDIPEEQDRKSAPEKENIDGSSGSFSLYEFLKKLQPKPGENNIVDSKRQERLNKQLLSRMSKSERNKTQIPTSSNSRISETFAGHGTDAFPITSIPMNAFQSRMNVGINNNKSETNKKTGNKKSQARSGEDITSTTFNNFFGNRKSELSNKTAKIMATLNDQGTDTRWRRITNLLMDIVHNPKKESPEKPDQADIFNQSNFFTGDGAEKYNLFDSILANWTSDLGSAMERRRGAPSRTILLLTSYSLLLLVSLFANLLVCHVVLRTRRLHTVTNTFLANLAVSDLVMTTMNIPFSVARVLLDDWPFGATMCCLVPFVQVVSVYVSSFTMAAIALDRYQVIIRPLRPRMGATHGVLIIAIIWVMAALLSLPYAIYNQVVEVFTYRRLMRCQPRYPPPALVFRRWLTLATFLTQYVLPLSLTLLAYAAVVRRVWWGAAVGVSTRQQATLRNRAKKKTVKMLMVVVILFALCWLPLNTYHLVVDFSSPVGSARHSSSVFFLCHWFAMSSVCYNPFIYCWLNNHFRAGARSLFTCAGRRIAKMLGCATRRRSCPGCMDDASDADLQNLRGFAGNTSRDGLAPLGVGITHQINSGETATSSSSSSSAITCVPFSSNWKGGGGSSILKKDNNREGTRIRNGSFRKQLHFGPHKAMDYFTSAKSHEVSMPMNKFLTRSRSERTNVDSSDKSFSIFRKHGFRIETNPVKSFPALSTCSSSFNKKNSLYAPTSGFSRRGLTRNLEDSKFSGNSNQAHRDGGVSHLDVYSGCLFTSTPDVKGLHVHFRSRLLPDNSQFSTNINDSPVVGQYNNRGRFFSSDNLHQINKSSVKMEEAKKNEYDLGLEGSQGDNVPRNRLRPCSVDDVRRRSYDNSVSHDVFNSKKRIGYGSIANDHHTQETSFRSENLEDFIQTPSERREQEFPIKQFSILDYTHTRSLGSNCISSPVRYETEAHYSPIYPRHVTTVRRHSFPEESTKSANNIEHQINWSTVIGSNAFCVFSSPNSSTASFRCYSVDYLNDS